MSNIQLLEMHLRLNYIEGLIKTLFEACETTYMYCNKRRNKMANVTLIIQTSNINRVLVILFVIIVNYMILLTFSGTSLT